MEKVKQWVDSDTVTYTETKQTEVVETISITKLKAELAEAEAKYQNAVDIANSFQQKITDLTGQISVLELDTDRPAE